MKQNPKIVITFDTKNKLDTLKLTPSETYNEIILRLFQYRENTVKKIALNILRK